MLNRPCWDLIKTAMVDELRLSPADEKEQALSDLRMAALERLWRLMGGYEERGFIEALLLPICEKKIQFIKAATTRADLTKNIFNHSAPRYSGGCFHEPKYYIPEEELVQWSMASLKGPLEPEASDRFHKIFAQCFPNRNVEAD